MPNFGERAGVAAYRPPAKDALDPVVVVGQPPKSRMRQLSSYLAVGVSLAGAAFNTVPRTWPWLILPVGLVTLVSALGVLRTWRPRSWRPPRLTLNAEGFTVTDSTGSITTALWQDVAVVTVRVTSARDLPTVTVDWVSIAGNHVVAELGDTFDVIDTYRAIRDQAPSTTEVRLIPKRVVGGP